MKKELKHHHFSTALRYTIVSLILFGVIYPLSITLLAHIFFPFQAGGSIIVSDGKKIGSALIGQRWISPRYFHGRPSAAGKGYDPTATGGTNLGPTSKKLMQAVAGNVRAVIAENPDAKGPVPPDLVTASASGIDPDISPEGAYFQIPRVALRRGLDERAVRALVDAHVRRRDLGFLGESRVNVLELNIDLDRLSR
jgi:K+-transporting ATPase ATPase C chain